MNLVKLAKNILEPVREHFQSEVIIRSGFRAPDVNKRAGGSPTSQYTRGQAADITVEGVSNRELACWIRDNLEFDLLRLVAYDADRNDGSFVGVSFAEGENRRRAITTFMRAEPQLETIAGCDGSTPEH